MNYANMMQLVSAKAFIFTHGNKITSPIAISRQKQLHLSPRSQIMEVIGPFIGMKLHVQVNFQTSLQIHNSFQGS